MRMNPKTAYEQRIRVRALGALMRRNPEQYEQLRQQLREQDPYDEEKETRRITARMTPKTPL